MVKYSKCRKIYHAWMLWVYQHPIYQRGCSPKTCVWRHDMCFATSFERKETLNVGLFFGSFTMLNTHECRLRHGESWVQLKKSLGKINIFTGYFLKKHPLSQLFWKEIIRACQVRLTRWLDFKMRYWICSIAKGYMFSNVFFFSSHETHRIRKIPSRSKYKSIRPAKTTSPPLEGGQCSFECQHLPRFRLSIDQQNGHGNSTWDWRF